jgi:hypothetical protein
MTTPVTNARVFMGFCWNQFSLLGCGVRFIRQVFFRRDGREKRPSAVISS